MKTPGDGGEVGRGKGGDRSHVWEGGEGRELAGIEMTTHRRPRSRNFQRATNLLCGKGALVELPVIIIIRENKRFIRASFCGLVRLSSDRCLV